MMDRKTTIKAALFESFAIALGLFIGAYMGDIAAGLHPLSVLCVFFFFSYGLNYLAARLFTRSGHWFMELMSSPPVLGMVTAFCLNIPSLSEYHMLGLILAIFLALSVHFYEAIIKMRLHGRS